MVMNLDAMALVWQFWKNKASAAQIFQHFVQCDAQFIAALEQRTAINDYAEKLTHLAIRFEAWSEDKLIGLVALYCNDQRHKRAYISNVTLLPHWQGNNIATQLLLKAIDVAKQANMYSIQLEVNKNNTAAIHLYEKVGFTHEHTHTEFIIMNLTLPALKGDN